ncbi:MAG: SDR family oxidoreductase [bacterium]|nr:SDR family oxidoreductase [bacterium]
MRLRDRVVVVTGAGTGIGRAIAVHAAHEGARVVIDYLGDPGDAQAVLDEITAAGGQARAVEADVTDADAVAHLMDAAEDAFGALDVLVNNAGVEEKHPFLDMPRTVWDRVIAVNLTAPWLAMQAAATRMVRRGRGGRIVNVSSVHEEIAMPTNAPYCAAKGGLRMLARTVALELAPHGITVNNVCPGAVDTPMDASVKRDHPEYETLLSEIPLHRLAKPHEIANLCVYLASDDAGYITGASYVIDGGMTKMAGSL